MCKYNGACNLLYIWRSRTTKSSIGIGGPGPERLLKVREKNSNILHTRAAIRVQQYSLAAFSLPDNTMVVLFSM